MERKIGETFEYQGKTYKVAEFDACINCAFRNIDCTSLRSITGNCIYFLRNDGVNVKFEEIKNDMEIKDNQLAINTPEGMEIDIENCDLKNGIIKFKKKELRYEDIENYLDLEGNRTGIPVDENNAFKLCATDRLMNIARYYNGDWKPDWKNPDSLKFSIWYDTLREKYDIEFCGGSVRNDVYFKNKKDAQAVIDNPNFMEILDAIFKN